MEPLGPAEPRGPSVVAPVKLITSNLIVLVTWLKDERKSIFQDKVNELLTIRTSDSYSRSPARISDPFGEFLQQQVSDGNRSFTDIADRAADISSPQAFMTTTGQWIIYLPRGTRSGCYNEGPPQHPTFQSRTPSCFEFLSARAC